jgi:hypothetical protein
MTDITTWFCPDCQKMMLLSERDGHNHTTRRNLAEDERARLIRDAALAAEDAFAQRGFALTNGQMVTLTRCAASILRELVP